MPRFFKNLLHCIWFNLSFIIASDQYWQQSVDYEMNVTLIDSVRQLACSSTIMGTDPKHNLNCTCDLPNCF